MKLLSLSDDVEAESGVGVGEVVVDDVEGVVDVVVDVGARLGGSSVGAAVFFTLLVRDGSGRGGGESFTTTPSGIRASGIFIYREPPGGLGGGRLGAVQSSLGMWRSYDPGP